MKIISGELSVAMFDCRRVSKDYFLKKKSGYNNSEPGAKRLNIMNIISAELDEDAQIG